MINLGPFTPLIILIVLVVLAFWAVMRLSKWRGARRGFWITGGYGIILVISVIVYYFFPVSPEENVGVEHPGQLEAFSRVLSGVESVTSIEEFLMEAWEFDYEEETLHIESRGDMHTVQIAVERTKDDVIEAAFYRTPLYFNGREVENDSIPVDIQLASDRLELLPSENSEEVNIASFTKEFPMQQFDDKNYNEPFWYEVGWSEQLLYLQVPEDIDISTVSGVQIKYIN